MEEDLYDSKIYSFVRSNILILILFAGGVIFLGVGLIQMYASKKVSVDFQKAEEVGSVSEAKIMVDVSGQVLNPGVYSLSSSSRIQDALIAAGGLSQDADRVYIERYMNLAQKVTDGAKIYIPRQNESIEQASTQVAGTSTEGLVSVNSATQSELEELPSIGPVTAEKIISGRPYSSVEELKTKQIVGEKTFEKIKDSLSL